MTQCPSKQPENKGVDEPLLVTECPSKRQENKGVDEPLLVTECPSKQQENKGVDEPLLSKPERVFRVENLMFRIISRTQSNIYGGAFVRK